MDFHIGEIISKETYAEMRSARLHNDAQRLTILSAYISTAIEGCHIQSTRQLLLDVNDMLKTAIRTLNNHNPKDEN